MIAKILFTLCLATGVSALHAVPASKTADSQMQGTPSDVELTRKIRDRLTNDDSLSTSAQNITIVTMGNTVTLKGNVEKREEVEKITATAHQLAGGKTIKNELRVKQ